MGALQIISILLICLYIAAAGLAVLPLVICFKDHMVTFTGTTSGTQTAFTIRLVPSLSPCHLWLLMLCFATSCCMCMQMEPAWSDTC